MKIHEYQAKEILGKHNVRIPFGVVIDKVEDASKAYDEVSRYSSIVVVKAQIHAGGRVRVGVLKLPKQNTKLCLQLKIYMECNSLPIRQDLLGKKY